MTTRSDIAIARSRRSEVRFAAHGTTADQFVLLVTLVRLLARAAAALNAQPVQVGGPTSSPSPKDEP